MIVMLICCLIDTDCHKLKNVFVFDLGDDLIGGPEGSLGIIKAGRGSG